MNADKYQIDMCHGPLFGKILLFALPLIATGILQLMFNAVDLIVVGRFASHQALAAIGATINMNSLIVNLLIGISVGANVVAARFFGAKDREKMDRTVHTAMAVSIFGGLVIMVLGLLVAKPLLVLMETPPDILPMSCRYIWICFASIPFIMIYNFGCAVLRASGDTRRPFIYLVIAGIINVLMNLFFVLVCGMDVGGVAFATAISQAISAALILIALRKGTSFYRMEWKKLRIDFQIFKEMLYIGIPAAISSTCFAVSNMLIQSSINSFGSYAIAGVTASISLEGITYVGSYSFHQTAIAFTAQNLGGHQYKRIRTSMLWCFLLSSIVCTVFGWGFYCSADWCLGFFNPDPEVIRWGVIRMKVMFTTYILCGLMDTASGGLRGLGYSLLSASCSLVGACVFRVWWVTTIFPRYRTMENLMLSYPVSWALVAAASIIFFFIFYRKIVRTQCSRIVSWSKSGPGFPRGFRYVGSPK